MRCLTITTYMLLEVCIIRECKYTQILPIFKLSLFTACGLDWFERYSCAVASSSVDRFRVSNKSLVFSSCRDALNLAYKYYVIELE